MDLKVRSRKTLQDSRLVLLENSWLHSSAQLVQNTGTANTWGPPPPTREGDRDLQGFPAISVFTDQLHASPVDLGPYKTGTKQGCTTLSHTTFNFVFSRNNNHMFSNHSVLLKASPQQCSESWEWVNHEGIVNKAGVEEELPYVMLSPPESTPLANPVN